MSEDSFKSLMQETGVPSSVMPVYVQKVLSSDEIIAGRGLFSK